MPKLVLRKILLVCSLLLVLMCPILYLASEFFTSSLSFLEPVLCPSGMHLERTTESLSDVRGNVTASNLVCTDGNVEVDITAKILVILFGVAALGVVLLVAWALTSSSKEGETAGMGT